MKSATDLPLFPGTLLRIGGQVQGVGFRPFVYRLATAAGLHGWVQNHGAEVLLLLQGKAQSTAALLDELLHRPPPPARPRLIEQQTVHSPPCNGFHIRPSAEHSEQHPHIPADFFVCDDCLAELNDPANRRYRYPFINCTQCGPRYTLIERLPYDRANTTLADFPLCPACRAEYEDPHDRRFHAEPIACPDCGPRLRYIDKQTRLNGNEPSLNTAVKLLAGGGILAVKGVGGYHLMCDARSDQAVERLRRRKARPHKPLAVMFPQSGWDGLSHIRQALQPTTKEADLLRSPLRPIVLCRKRHNDTLAFGVAPDLGEVGAMLPYSPLHHLLCQAFDAPLVATSGNISGEPVITDENEAEQRLMQVADAFLHHNRPIRRPADDPVYREIGGSPRPLRLGRGNAPLEYELPFTLSAPVLAVGGEMKNTVALAWENRLALSPHIGELQSPRGLQLFEQVIADQQQLYGIEATAVAHDAHPNYNSSRWAKGCGLPAHSVLHHHAHASALYAEHWPERGEEQWLVATWDGVGYGSDGTLWGGETLIGRPGNWRHFARFRPFRLPGGEKAAREPWRSALGLCLESDIDWKDTPQPTEADLLTEAWRRGLNSPKTTAVGRLFDAAAALMGLLHISSYEGQAAMMLETAADQSASRLSLPLEKTAEGIWQCDWKPLIPMLLDKRTPIKKRAAVFHHSLAHALSQQALQARAEYGIHTIGLAGGVFQNRYLVESIRTLLHQHGFTVRSAHDFPCNDAGLALGQIVEMIHSAQIIQTDHL
ncbi:MAG: carbamoyltransferase HypF [Pseudomonadota bacterium]